MRGALKHLEADSALLSLTPIGFHDHTQEMMSFVDYFESCIITILD